MLRGCIIAVVCVAALVIIAGAIGAWYIFHTVKPAGVSAREFVLAARRDAEKFAQGKTDVDCVNEAMRRASAATDMAGQARASMFLRGCIDAARDTGYCSHVPAGFFGGPKWAADQCRHQPAQRAVGDPCVGVMTSVYQACQQRRWRR